MQLWIWLQTEFDRSSNSIATVHPISDRTLDSSLFYQKKNCPQWCLLHASPPPPDGITPDDAQPLSAHPRPRDLIRAYHSSTSRGCQWLWAAVARTIILVSAKADQTLLPAPQKWRKVPWMPIHLGPGSRKMWLTYFYLLHVGSVCVRAQWAPFPLGPLCPAHMDDTPLVHA